MTPNPEFTDDKALEQVLDEKATKFFIFTYRDGIQSLPVFSVIRVSSNALQRNIVARCQKYCKQKNLRYVSVRPFILDLSEGDESEKSTGEVKMPVAS